MTETDQTKPYTDADVDLAVGASKPGQNIRAHTTAVLDAMVAAGWRPPLAPQTPPYVHHLLDAFLTGEPLNFHRAPVPLDVQRRLAHAVAAGQMGTVPAPAPLDTVGRCGDESPLVLSAARPAFCALSAGHGGWHRSGDTEWTNGAIPNWSHEIAFGDDGEWSIGHPDGCPGQAFGDCDVARLAGKQIGGTRLVDAFALDLAGHRFRCAVNDLHDRFLLGDRIDDRAATLAQIRCESAQLDDDLAAGRVADRLGDPPLADSASHTVAQEQHSGPVANSVELPALVFNAISRALQDVWPISVPLPVVRERCTAAVLEALEARRRLHQAAHNPVGLVLGSTAQPDHQASPAQDTDPLADRLAGVVADMLAHFRISGHPGEQSQRTGWVPNRSITAWRAVYAEWAEREG